MLKYNIVNKNSNDIYISEYYCFDCILNQSLGEHMRLQKKKKDDIFFLHLYKNLT